MFENDTPVSAKDVQWDLNVAARDLVPTYINHFAVYAMSGNTRINMGETLYAQGSMPTHGAPRLAIVINTERSLELAKIILRSYSTGNPSNKAVASAVEILGPLLAK